MMIAPLERGNASQKAAQTPLTAGRAVIPRCVREKGKKNAGRRSFLTQRGERKGMRVRVESALLQLEVLEYNYLHREIAVDRQQKERSTHEHKMCTTLRPRCIKIG